MPSIMFNVFQQIFRSPRFQANTGRNIVEIFAGSEERKADPSMLQIEVTSRCNFHCSYCIVHNGSERERPRDMSMDMFQRVLDRFPRSFYLQLHGQGEPLLNPRLVDMVALTERQKRFSSIVTNGSLWTEARSKALLSAGVDVIAFSLDIEDPKAIEANRVGLKYEKVVDTIREVIQWRNEIRPVTSVGVSAVFRRSLLDHPTELEAYVKRLDDLGIDFLFVGPLAGTKSYMDRYSGKYVSEIIPSLNGRRLVPFATHCTVNETPSMNFHRNRCIWPWMALYINTDGRISYCSNNHRLRVGHINDPGAINLAIHRDLRKQFNAGEIPEGCKGCQYLLAMNGDNK